MDKLLKNLQISYQNIHLYEQAMIHPSMHNELHSDKNNQRLEFLGDSVLGLVMTNYLFYAYENEREGELSKLRASFVCEEALVYYSEKLDVKRYIKIGKSEKIIHDSVVADAFEALIGALFLDLGLAGVQTFFDNNLKGLLKIGDFVKIDYKSKLQELVQADKRTIIYRLIKQEGPPHAPTFYVDVMMEDIILGRGVASSKKKAEQLAAKSALEKMASASD